MFDGRRTELKTQKRLSNSAAAEDAHNAKSDSHSNEGNQMISISSMWDTR